MNRGQPFAARSVRSAIYKNRAIACWWLDFGKEKERAGPFREAAAPTQVSVIGTAIDSAHRLPKGALVRAERDFFAGPQQPAASRGQEGQRAGTRLVIAALRTNSPSDHVCT